jgi:hypothetical protein
MQYTCSIVPFLVRVGVVKLVVDCVSHVFARDAFQSPGAPCRVPFFVPQRCGCEVVVLTMCIPLVIVLLFEFNR